MRRALVKPMQDSILEFRLLNCKLTSRTLGAQGTSVPTTSNISFPWTPPTNLGHEIGSVLQIGSFWIRLQITELPWARYLVDAIRGTQRVILHTKYMSCPKSQQNKKSQPYKMTCPTLRLYNLVSKIPVREHIGFFRTKFRWIQFGKADLFWDLFTFTWKNLVRRWISNTMSTNGLDPPTSLLSTLWDNCWINGGQSGVWHCSWCATRACFQPTFVLFNPGMTTLQAAGTRQWCWLRFPRRRDFVTGFAFCWWCPCMCKIVWGNRSCVGHAGRCLPKSWFCTERWEKQKKNGAEPTSSRTSSRTCIVWRNRCADFGTRPWAKWSGCMIVFEWSALTRMATTDLIWNTTSKLHPRFFTQTHRH